MTKGPYDTLYRAKGIVWGDSPGRMVGAAVKRIKTPGRALDIGCGDGKNISFLERRGWIVDGLDISNLAKHSFLERCRMERRRHRGCYEILDCNYWTPRKEYYDLVICYGLMHCLIRDVHVRNLLERMRFTLKRGGIVAIAVLNDSHPMPAGHGTTQLFLRRGLVYVGLFSKLNILTVKHGKIKEKHEPVISTHMHGVTWALLQK